MSVNNFFTTVLDQRGLLKSVELNNFNLFKIKRIFILEFKDKIARGDHAHKKCKQYIICSKGKVQIDYIKNNVKNKKILYPNMKGLYIPPKTWVVLKPILKNTEIFCLCDMKYLKSDYIKDFNKFITAKYFKKNKLGKKKIIKF
jgi:UDP-2-acetamido-3-amino-2,3-dideoxy-glucuronate N-acetyltransferase